MTSDHLHKALDVVRAAVTENGKKLLPYYGNIETIAKSETGNVATDVVTALDRETETFLMERFKAFDPSIGFRGEEFGVSTEGATTWLVDPIDGTSHFVRGLPFCTTMVALIDKGEVVLSVIYDFVRGDTYWAIRGEGAYRNEERLHMPERTLAQSILSFEINTDIGDNTELYKATRKRSGGMLHTVNCGWEFAMIASGKIDGRLAKDPWGYDWDFAPGSLLVSEAGGIVANHGLSSYDYRNHDYIAANRAAYAELTEGPDALFPLAPNP